MLRKMICLEPKERLTVPQILSHAWLKDTNDDTDESSSDNSQGGDPQDDQGGDG